mmetsp:Transcript_15366/g.38104  ORF Transcript_15366/g.38104 Transcript_15366/m.38104 type:complete len:91 (+) Transcript_15366:5548-5820(+)
MANYLRVIIITNINKNIDEKTHSPVHAISFFSLYFHNFSVFKYIVQGGIEQMIRNDDLQDHTAKARTIFPQLQFAAKQHLSITFPQYKSA